MTENSPVLPHWIDGTERVSASGRAAPVSITSRWLDPATHGGITLGFPQND